MIAPNGYKRIADNVSKKGKLKLARRFPFGCCLWREKRMGEKDRWREKGIKLIFFFKLKIL